MPFISFYDYTTSREITQEENEKIDKKIKHFECLHRFLCFKSVKLPFFVVATNYYGNKNTFYFHMDMKVASLALAKGSFNRYANCKIYKKNI